VSHDRGAEERHAEGREEGAKGKNFGRAGNKFRATDLGGSPECYNNKAKNRGGVATFWIKGHGQAARTDLDLSKI